MSKKPVVLIIRDGWGIDPQSEQGQVSEARAQELGNAPALAQTPFHDELWASAPMGRLSASGEDVGLPAGQMGNSEVGHLNLGAGRIVYQNLSRIDRCIAENGLGEIEALAEALTQAKSSRLHLIGLVSDGGVHSHYEHLLALANTAHTAGVEKIAVHAIMDGRDTSPTSGADFLQTVETPLAQAGAEIWTVIGRYFAMDRDNRWERVQKAWAAIVEGQGSASEQKPHEAVAAAYQAGQTDEFLEPLLFSHAGQERIKDDDVVLFFNFRSDRARQISQPFLHDNFAGFERKINPKVHYLSMTEYDASFDCAVLFGPQIPQQTLGEVVSEAGLKQLRIAETEKYPHVTYFFNGGEEKPNAGEERIIIPSPKVATYDLQPEMSAPAVTEAVLEKLPEVDLVILNFANPDMVGHTGDLDAAMRACEEIDAGVKAVAEKTLALGGQLLITADHGNCEQMRQKDGSPHTAHTTNLVSCWYLGANQDEMKVQDGILADIAPTLLDMLDVAQPKEMTGKSLLARG